MQRPLTPVSQIAQPSAGWSGWRVTARWKVPAPQAIWIPPQPKASARLPVAPGCLRRRWLWRRVRHVWQLRGTHRQLGHANRGNYLTCTHGGRGDPSLFGHDDLALAHGGRRGSAHGNGGSRLLQFAHLWPLGHRLDLALAYLWCSRLDRAWRHSDGGRRRDDEIRGRHRCFSHLQRRFQRDLRHLHTDLRDIGRTGFRRSGHSRFGRDVRHVGCRLRRLGHCG